jgi:hypothetical protein
MEGKERRTGRAGKRSSGGGRGKQMQATCHKDACPHTYTDTPTLSHEVVVSLNGEYLLAQSIPVYPLPTHTHQSYRTIIFPYLKSS